MTRGRLYALIESFEFDLRHLIRAKLLDHMHEQLVFGPEFEATSRIKASEKSAQDYGLETYLNLRTAFDILQRHKEKLSDLEKSQLQEINPHISTFVATRNRVMHGRPLLTSDPEVVVNLFEFLNKNVFEESCRNFELYKTNENWDPSYKVRQKPDERVIHNLPAPEYDDTGLIGRASEVSEIVDKLKRGKTRVITITGEGGIGKTALAIDAAYRLADDPESDFDCILWQSLKTRQLTTSGVIEIENNVRTVLGANLENERFLASSLGAAEESLANIFQGLNALIIIDNLETDLGEDIVHLIETLEDATFLFTSRIGIGQLERRINLGQLSTKDATLYFRRLVSFTNLEKLKGLSDSAASALVQDLRNSPLAIKWYVFSVESGKDPVSLPKDQRDLIAYCIGNVYESINKDSREILEILNTLNRAISVDEIAIYCELHAEQIRDAVQELLNKALVTYLKSPNGELPSQISLTETASEYLVVTERLVNVEKVLRLDREYRENIERKQSTREDEIWLTRSIHSATPANDPAVFKLRFCLNLIERDQFETAIEYLSKAKELDPAYFEVLRVEALYWERQEDLPKATVLYKEAVSKSRDELSTGLANFHQAQFHLNCTGDKISAETSAREAVRAVPSAVIPRILLAQILAHRDKFSEANEILQGVLNDNPDTFSDDAVIEAIELTRYLAENLWSQDAESSIDLLFEGVILGIERGAIGFSDVSQIQTVTVQALRTVCRVISSTTTERSQNHLQRLASIIDSLMASDVKPTKLDVWPRFMGALSLVMHTAIQHQLPIPGIIAALLEPESSGASYKEGFVGEVMNVSKDRSYAFIKHPLFTDNVYFHLQSTVDASETHHIKNNMRVFFTQVINFQGKMQCRTVIPAEPFRLE